MEREARERERKRRTRQHGEAEQRRDKNGGIGPTYEQRNDSSKTANSAAPSWSIGSRGKKWRPFHRPLLRDLPRSPLHSGCCPAPFSPHSCSSAIRVERPAEELISDPVLFSAPAASRSSGTGMNEWSPTGGRTSAHKRSARTPLCGSNACARTKMGKQRGSWRAVKERRAPVGPTRRGAARVIKARETTVKLMSVVGANAAREFCSS